MVHRLEPRLGRLDQQRDGAHAGRQDRGAPGERQLDAEATQRAADRSPPADDEQQVIAEHGGRQDQRQDHRAIEEVASRKAPARQGPGQGQPHQQRQRRGGDRDLDGEPDGSQVHVRIHPGAGTPDAS